MNPGASVSLSLRLNRRVVAYSGLAWGQGENLGRLKSPFQRLTSPKIWEAG